MNSILSSTQLFDLQVNGFAGVDFQSDSLNLSDMAHAAKCLLKHNTAGILFTLITDTVENLCRKLENIEKLRSRDKDIASVIKGYHLEGPWISKEPGYYGAHPLEYVSTPTLADYRRLRDAACGRLKLITLAPEVDGAISIIEASVKDGIRIGLGHTNASEEIIDAAINAKATLATHVGNAVPLLLHRHDNIIQRLLERDELIACMIPDGIHLPPFALKNFFRAKPRGKTFFTTDCMSAAGAPSGTYKLGPHTVEVGADGVVHMPGETRFAGSSLTMNKGLENIVQWLDITESDALEMCSNAPATHFGIEL
ncbi:hypothetical protein MLD52_19260 [Puniceicoccaceae bacterium K14]|nr:hypothetical protein [Puniceicoccaceae bacterium K14]